MPPAEPALVTVIIATRNAGAFIGETLQSVRAQTYPHYECLIIDGQSTDGTRAIIEQFADQDKRFVLIDQKPSQPGFRAVSMARNQGLAAAKGKLIAFLDADDVWLPEKLARQVEQFKNRPEINLSFTNYFYWDGKQDMGLRYEKARQFPVGDLRVAMFYSCCFGFSTVLVRRELLQAIGGFDEAMPEVEDWDLWMRAAAHGIKAMGSNEALTRYRIHETNAVHNILRVCEYDVIVLEKNRPAINCSQVVRRHHHRALQKARSRLELARTRQKLDSAPQEVQAGLWRAWRLYPAETKWLVRWALLGLPNWLGGKSSQKFVHKKLRTKF